MPYPWPYDGALEAARCALLVVNDGYSLPGQSPAAIEEHIRMLTAAANACGVLVVQVSTARPDRRPDPRRDAKTAAIEVAKDTTAVHATGVDGFFGSPLDGLLRREHRDQLLFAGHYLETSVHSTLRSANDRGYECLTIADACLPADTQTQRGAISSIEMSGGIFGAVGSTRAVITGLNQLAVQPDLATPTTHQMLEST
jgi:nicotinamidase-related amidase